MITAKDTDRMRTTTSFPVPGLLTCLLLSLLLSSAGRGRPRIETVSTAPY